MFIIEVGFRAISSIFTKEGFSFLVGGLIASFIMIHSHGYSKFIVDLNDYLIEVLSMVLGT
ncbi:hypothetical protein GCM10025767_06650 [Thalassotalea piscium]|uniref:Uncharacterized protein n=1 Tax=Thalassotalea piscium TaxID=1230533 RepID=A0A7X0NKI7_9GAMM|nr:hypothetical protein [Thalassotalea piscium]